MIFLILLGSVGRNMGRKTNVYISSSAGARWREVRAPAHQLSRSGGAAGGMLIRAMQPPGTKGDLCACIKELEDAECPLRSKQKGFFFFFSFCRMYIL